MFRKIALFLVALLACACESDITLTEGPETHIVTIEVNVLAGDVHIDLWGVTFAYGKNDCLVYYSTVSENTASCDIDLDAPGGAEAVTVEVEKESFISHPRLLPVDLLRADHDRHVTVDIPIARDLRGTGWSCTKFGVVDGMSTSTEETREGAVEVEFDPGCNCYSLRLVMWEENLSILGDTLFGEGDGITYTGEAYGNFSFGFFRAATDDPDDGFEFLCG